MLDAIDEALRAQLCESCPKAGWRSSTTLCGTRSRAPSRRRGAPACTAASAAVLAERARRAPARWLAPLAHHALAAASEDAEPAIGYALEAAQLAVERLAWEDAVELLARAEALARRRRRRPSGWPRCSLRSATRACAPARATPAALPSRRRRGSPAPPRATTCSRAAALGTAGLGVTIVVGRRAVDRAPRGGARGLGPEPGALRVRVLSRLAIALAYAPAEKRRRALAEKAVATARSAADPGALAVALTASHVVHWAPEHLRTRLAAADELVTLGERGGDAEIELHGRHWRVVDLLERGDVAAAEERDRALRALAAEARLRPSPGTCPPGARRSPATGATSPRRGGWPTRRTPRAHAPATTTRTSCRGRTTTCWIVRGGVGRVRPLLPRARVDSPAGRSYRAYLAHCLAELGDDEAARALLTEAAARASTACRGTRTS